MTLNSIVEIDNHDNYSIIRFFGFVDAGTVEQVRPLIQSKIPENCANIIVDLEKVDFLDSHGVGLFASLMKKAHLNNGRLVFAMASTQPASVLNMVGFNSEIVTYCKDMKQAATLLDAAGRH